MFRSGPRMMVARFVLTAFGIALLGTGARAGDDPAADAAAQGAKRHSAEMNKGKDHEEAREAARLRDDQRTAQQTKRHAAEMNRGKNHEEAREAARPSADAEKVMKRSKGHEEGMNKGKNHEEARSAADGK